MAEIRSALGQAIRVARARRGWSGAELARRAGMDRKHLSMIERGLRDPALSTQEKIAKAIGMTVGELLTLAERERPGQPPG